MQKRDCVACSTQEAKLNDPMIHLSLSQMQVLLVSASKSEAPHAKAFLSLLFRYLSVNVIFGRRLNTQFATFSTFLLFKPSGHYPVVSGLAGMGNNPTFKKKKTLRLWP